MTEQGRSFVAQLKDPKAPGKDHAYTVVTRGEKLGRSVRYGKFRYAEWGDPGQNELYNLQADPRELTNLARLPEHKAEVLKGRRILNKAAAAASKR